MGGPERGEGQAATTGSLDLSLRETGCRGRVSCPQITLALQRRAAVQFVGQGTGGVSQG